MGPCTTDGQELSSTLDRVEQSSRSGCAHDLMLHARTPKDQGAQHSEYHLGSTIPFPQKKNREKSAVRTALHKLLGCYYYYYCYYGVLPEGDNGNAVGTLGSDVTNRREFSGCSSVSLFLRRGQCSEAIVIATMDYM